MKKRLAMLCFLMPTLAYAGSDSLFVSKSDGTMQAFDLDKITEIVFSSTSDSLTITQADNAASKYLINSLSDLKFGSSAASINDETMKLSKTFSLRAAPNPFVESTSIQLTAAESGMVEAYILDMQGNTVRTFATQFVAANAMIEYKWDGLNDRNETTPAGTYLSMIRLNGNRTISPIIYIK